MEFVNKLVGATMIVANSNAVINVCLIGFFLALNVRSVNQQKDIEALECEKEALFKSNKAIKKTLFAEADFDSALVPLARLKLIYSEAPTPPTGDAVKEDAKSPASKLVI